MLPVRELQVAPQTVVNKVAERLFGSTGKYPVIAIADTSPLFRLEDERLDVVIEIAELRNKVSRHLDWKYGVD